MAFGEILKAFCEIKKEIGVFRDSFITNTHMHVYVSDTHVLIFNQFSNFVLSEVMKSQKTWIFMNMKDCKSINQSPF